MINSLRLFILATLSLILAACATSSEKLTPAQQCDSLKRQMIYLNNSNSYEEANQLRQKKIAALKKQYNDLKC